MPVHKLRCPYCRTRVRVRMDTATDKWTFVRHYLRGGDVCPGTGRSA